MATWTDIANSDIDQDSPITVSLMTAYRDNLAAAFEGASGAPSLEDAALGTTATTTGTDWVNARLALLTAGGIGTLAFAQYSNTSTNLGFGDTVAGSNLKPWYAIVASGSSTESALSGTWRCLGYCPKAQSSDPFYKYVTLYIRIS